MTDLVPAAAIARQMQPSRTHLWVRRAFGWTVVEPPLFHPFVAFVKSGLPRKFCSLSGLQTKPRYFRLLAGNPGHQGGAHHSCERKDDLLLEDHWRSADPRGMEINSNLHTIGNLDEGDAAVHPVFLPIEGHGSCNRACACPPAGNRQEQLLCFLHSTDRKVAVHLKGFGTGLYYFG